MWYNGQHNAKTFADTVDFVVEGLKDVEFDTIVFRGFSGAVVGTVAAYRLGKDWALVRKEGESTHSTRRIEGAVGDRYVIVDDFIDSGETVKKTLSAVRNGCNAQCVGLFLYDRGWIKGCKAKATRDLFRGRVGGIKILNWNK